MSLCDLNTSNINVVKLISRLRDSGKHVQKYLCRCTYYSGYLVNLWICLFNCYLLIINLSFRWWYCTQLLLGEKTLCDVLNFKWGCIYEVSDKWTSRSLFFFSCRHRWANLNRRLIQVESICFRKHNLLKLVLLGLTNLQTNKAIISSFIFRFHRYKLWCYFRYQCWLGN